MSNLTILNTAIRQSDNLFCLNDLHQVSGKSSAHQPSNFTRLDTTQALVTAIQAEGTANPIKTLRGTQGGTYACKEIVIAYAAWISPQFHLVVLRAFLNQLENSQKTKQIAPLAPTTLPPEEQLMVQNAVKATHDRTGLSYGEIWARTKNKFKVAKYEQIERTQLRDVLIYIASISAIRTVGKDDIIVPANIFAAIMQHTRLARKLAEKVEPFHRQLQEMIGIDRWYKNDIAALAYDVRAEFNYFLEKGEELVEQNRREQNEINFANARLKKII